MESQERLCGECGILVGLAEEVGFLLPQAEHSSQGKRCAGNFKTG